jgi:hypothetical protein
VLVPVMIMVVPVIAERSATARTRSPRLIEVGPLLREQRTSIIRNLMSA